MSGFGASRNKKGAHTTSAKLPFTNFISPLEKGNGCKRARNRSLLHKTSISVTWDSKPTITKFKGDLCLELKIFKQPLSLFS